MDDNFRKYIKLANVTKFYFVTKVGNKVTVPLLTTKLTPLSVFEYSPRRSARIVSGVFKDREGSHFTFCLKVI